MPACCIAFADVIRPDTAASAKPIPPPPGPSKTFTIDIPMPADADVATSFEQLRLSHEGAIDNLVDVSEGTSEGEGDENDNNCFHRHGVGGRNHGYDVTMAEGSPVPPGDWLATSLTDGPPSGTGSVVSQASSLPVGASALSTPPSCAALGGSGGVGGTARSREGLAAAPPAAAASSKSPQGNQRTAAVSLGLRPQFNLDSAAALLATFRNDMLAHFPCIVIEDAATVTDLARERPFVLLAVLAASSSSRTLQGHNLYDEEFIKILGLKFVAGGDRSVELLQGLIVYVTW